MFALRTQALVIGGGLTGCAAAYHLAKAGGDVLLVESSDLNTRASGRNSGGFHVQIQFDAFATMGEAWAHKWVATTPLLIDAVGRWQALERELDVDLEVRVHGGLLTAETNDQMVAIERKASIEAAAGLDVSLLSSRDVHQHAQYLSTRIVGGLLVPLEGKANPLRATPALAHGARSHGARLVLRTHVLEIQPTSSGYRVETTRGKIECEQIINCAGTAAGEIAALVGAELPVESYPLQTHVTEPVAPLLNHLVSFAGDPLTVKQAAAGSILIGGGWPADVGTCGQLFVSESSLRSNLLLAQRVIPALARARLLRTWTGECNGTPDHRPIIGELASASGFFVAVFPFLGFTAGPLMGKVIADIARGQPAGYDLAPFSPGRF